MRVPLALLGIVGVTALVTMTPLATASVAPDAAPPYAESTISPVNMHGPGPNAMGADRATTIPKLWKNCTNVNKRYPHGVGKAGARDHTSGTRVTNFKHSTKLYKLAMSYNRGLDGDKDGIACEKR